MKFALFVAFFPQLVAGPIVRARQFLPQLEKDPTFDEGRMISGLFRIMEGLVKKVVIADTLGRVLVDPVYADPQAATGLQLLLAMWGFYLQLGADFMGYTDMAIGSARLLGFELPENFRAPVRATNLEDFWGRWHITLTTWVRDYFYIPMTLSRKERNSIAPYINIILTMVLIGFWHGANWTFIVFGLIHGVGLALHRLRRRLFKTPPIKISGGWKYHLQTVFNRFVTMHVVAISCIFFRARNTDQVGEFFRSMFSADSWSSGGQLDRVALFLAIGIVIIQLLPESIREKFELWFAKMPAPLLALFVFLLFGLIAVFSEAETPFIYFRF